MKMMSCWAQMGSNPVTGVFTRGGKFGHRHTEMRMLCEDTGKHPAGRGPDEEIGVLLP